MSGKKKTKSKYNAFDNIQYALGGAWIHKKSIWANVIIQAITLGLFQYVWIYAAKRIISLLETNESSNFNAFFWIVAIAAIVEVIILIGKEVSFRQIEAGMLQVRMQFILMNMKKVFSLPYEMIENPDVQDAKQNGDWAIENMTRGIEGIVKNCSKLLGNLMVMIVAIYFLLQLNGWIVFFMLLFALCRILFEAKTAQIEKEELYDQLAQEHRKAQYYNGITTNFEYAKDSRLFHMKKPLSFKQAEVLDFIHSKVVFMQNKWRNSWLKANGVSLLQEGIMYAWLVYEVVANDLSIADFTLYIASIRVSSEAVAQALYYFVLIHMNSRQISDFRSFIEYGEEQTKKSSYKKDYYAIVRNNEQPIPHYDSYSFRFENVSFHYLGREEYALKNINLTLEAGKRLAVVGLNGAGKSTFIKLLCRLYEPTEGVILLNGVDIQTYSREEYYKLIAPVFQNVECFAFPLAENVSMKVPEQTDKEKALQCLQKAGLGKKVKELPKGIDTEMLRVLHDEGVDLSGGEKQKMSLAKALYKDAPVVVLDEPTAALDALAEYQTYQDFDKLIGNKTAVYISHRLSSTRFCDKIALFENGEIVEYGTHEELLQQNGAYANMFQLQSQYYTEGVTACD